MSDAPWPPRLADIPMALLLSIENARVRRTWKGTARRPITVGELQRLLRAACTYLEAHPRSAGPTQGQHNHEDDDHADKIDDVTRAARSPPALHPPERLAPACPRLQFAPLGVGQFNPRRSSPPMPASLTRNAGQKITAPPTWLAIFD